MCRWWLDGNVKYFLKRMWCRRLKKAQSFNWLYAGERNFQDKLNLCEGEIILVHTDICWRRNFSESKGVTMGFIKDWVGNIRCERKTEGSQLMYGLEWNCYGFVLTYLLALKGEIIEMKSLFHENQFWNTFPLMMMSSLKARYHFPHRHYSTRTEYNPFYFISHHRTHINPYSLVIIIFYIYTFLPPALARIQRFSKSPTIHRPSKRASEHSTDHLLLYSKHF